jgi:hypothetical protein
LQSECATLIHRDEAQSPDLRPLAKNPTRPQHHRAGGSAAIHAGTACSAQVRPGSLVPTWATPARDRRCRRHGVNGAQSYIFSRDRDLAAKRRRREADQYQSRQDWTHMLLRFIG